MGPYDAYYDDVDTQYVRSGCPACAPAAGFAGMQWLGPVSKRFARTGLCAFVRIDPAHQ
jgi:hypothetical protein